MERPSLRAGQVAASAGVHRETLRYYERRRLIPAPPRRLSGYRAYPVETVERIRLIKWAQGLGCSLREMRHQLRAIVRCRCDGNCPIVARRWTGRQAMPSGSG